MARSARRALATFAFGAWSVLGASAVAQTLGLSTLGAGAPLEVVADGGIEWRQNNKLFIARGNARATRGEVTIYADEITAAYRDAPDAQGGMRSKVFRLEAAGAVRIVSTEEKAFGDRVVYDVDSEVFVLTGRSIRLITETDEIRSRDSLEYWAAKKLAVARGQAVAIRGERRLRADILTAHFHTGERAKGGDDRGRIELIEAFDNIWIRTPTDVVRGDRGAYDVESGIATLAGSVKITRGGNQLNGDYAQVNLRTGVSRLLADPAGAAGSGRVFGLIRPEGKENKEPRP
jgi:lipopolysaccharide export system protein LptA